MNRGHYENINEVPSGETILKTDLPRTDNISNLATTDEKEDMDTDNDQSPYDLYKGKIKKDDTTKPIKIYNNKCKYYFIEKYDQNANTVLDIGSGRGSDIIYLAQFGVKNYIGIEPSDNSIGIAIKTSIAHKDKVRVTYINAVGNKLWSDGSAGLTDDAKKYLVTRFRNNIGTNIVHLFWTIHYMMDTDNDFLNLFHNIRTNIVKGSKVIILFMNGMRIHKEIKKNDGMITIKNESGDKIFELGAKYDYNNKKFDVFGNKISVYMSGAYGLQNTIEENLVVPDILIQFFEKNKFKLQENINFLDINKEFVAGLKDYQKEVIGYYMGLVFEFEG